MEHAVTDIRYEDDYARFYMEFAGLKHLPPPLEGGTLYQEFLQKHRQQQQQQQQQQQLLNAAVGLGSAIGRPPPGGCACMRMRLHEYAVPRHRWYKFVVLGS
jgi:hypothetical protein